ncbi:MAG TPA: hypothetical protein RMH85_00110 [Polyangiaceae bacterium LLY-WYZ-15_(1-7)]|nr:hypothetical protein [Myxococcales bacterium]MAT27086.1 hypothetical protein [Sandaracinus sp.]HJK90991.1 hypothetical protein [Polyangiaceae bacterium LLY-WYZ-15_(1-7)]MBJ73196.1 hypothetical protein [Sandaracinus sp.]HJL00309.1 hypothetical protein [Polyangiaceae bacterium LLY-WYZ-15_(1-7)]
MAFGAGLRPVPTEDLVALLRALHRGRLAYPLRREALLLMGMNRLAEHADLLVGLDERGLRSVLTAVIAERRRPAP